MSKIFFFMTIFILAILKVKAQVIQPDPSCTAIPDTTAYTRMATSANQPGGWLMPAFGTMKVVIIFAEFPDDTYDTTDVRWIKGQAPNIAAMTPMTKIIDSVWTGTPTLWSLTDYYNVMSRGALHFIGDTFHVVTPQRRSWYLQNSKRAIEIHRDIVRKLDDRIDFSTYDRWRTTNSYTHDTVSPDMNVDFVYIVWRNIAQDIDSPPSTTNRDVLGYYWGSWAALSETLEGSDTISVDGGLRKVRLNFENRPISTIAPGWGGGATLSNWLPGTYFNHIPVGIFPSFVHEMGHYYFGYNSSHDGRHNWAMLGAGNRNYMANSWERYRLDWIATTSFSISSNLTVNDIELGDYITTGDAIKVNIDAANHEYFFLENHQRLSRWDVPDESSSDAKGLFALRRDGQYDGSGGGKQTKTIPADGRHDWTMSDTVASSWNSAQYVPVFRRKNADRINGYSDCDFIPYTRLRSPSNIPMPHPIFVKRDEKDTTILHAAGYPNGDGKDAFRPEYNNVFSPWSNSNSYDRDKINTGFGFEITDTSGGVYTLDLYFNEAVDASPSKPQDLRVSVPSGTHPVLHWLENIEPDLESYKIYRQETSMSGTPSANSWTLITTINAFDNSNNPVTTFTDNDISNANNSTITPFRYWYAITAIDDTDKESVKSTFDYVDGHDISDEDIDPPPPCCSGKIGDQAEEQNGILRFSPNPAHENVNIAYTLSERSAIVLSVLNSFGNKVALLSEGIKNAGTYNYNMTTDNLPSGVYTLILEMDGRIVSQSLVILK